MDLGKEFKNYATKHLGVNDQLVNEWEKLQQAIYGPINSLTPMILEERELRVTQMSVFDRLLMDRIIHLYGPVNDHMCAVTQAQLMFLDSVEKKDITLHMSTPGGSVMAGTSMVSVMNHIKSDVIGVNMGLCASMGSILLGACTKGKRFSLPFSKVMIHQVSSSTGGHVVDNRINHYESEKYNYVLFKMLSEFSGRDFNEVLEIANRDKWFNAEETLEFGLIDEVLYPEGSDKKGMTKYLEGFEEYYQNMNK